MKFKKLIATTMALSMVLTFSGCTSKSSDAGKNSSSTQSSTAATTKEDSSDDLNARWMLFISRKMSFLPSIRMPGTNSLVL